ncbi:6550_t:CDS:2 [Gigaspora rosea]|nr:6550_t:CDS:2 [Gigaspora rosea]
MDRINKIVLSDCRTQIADSREPIISSTLFEISPSIYWMK